MFEKPGIAQAEQGDSVKLERFIETLAEGYRALEAPIGNDGRIDMQEYTEMYPDVARDLQRNKEWEAEWQKQGQSIDRRQTDGEKLEMLAYAIFAKNLGEQFIVARSSPHDDRVNKIDTLLLDSRTGNLVCAFDEVGDTSGAIYEKKQAAVRERNLKGGASLKYGIGIAERNGEKAIVLSSANNVPVFYVALPKDRIEKGIREFVPEMQRQSDFEKKLFSYFVGALSFQVNGLELYSNRLDPDLKKRLDGFKKVLDSLNSGGNEKK